MKKLLAMLAMVSFSALAVPVFTDPYGNTGTLTEEACKIPALVGSNSKHAVLVVDGKTYQACYIVVDGLVILIDEEGDMFQIPHELFKE